METYTDTAHGLTYELDERGFAWMRCRSCGVSFRGRPSDTESDAAPYDSSGDPYCGSCREE